MWIAVLQAYQVVLTSAPMNNWQGPFPDALVRDLTLRILSLWIPFQRALAKAGTSRSD